MGPRFNVSSVRQLIILVGQPGTRTHTCRDLKHYVHESYALSTELIGQGHGNIYLNPLPHIPILGSSNSAANKEMVSKI